MQIRLSQASGVPFYRQVEEQVADRIRAGQLAPGTLLPSVRQLAADLLVSVITVKRAYDDLEAAGLVTSHQGRGTYVSDGAGPAARRQLDEALSAELAALVRRARALGVDPDHLRRAFDAAMEEP